jgi:spore coat protein JC
VSTIIKHTPSDGRRSKQLSVSDLASQKGITVTHSQGFAPYYVDHTLGIYPASAAGVPFEAAYFQSKGDPITDLHEDMAAEQKARTTYENLLRLADDPDVLEPLRFLRAREIVHYQRFGEMLRNVTEALQLPHHYALNSAFDLKQA